MNLDQQQRGWLAGDAGPAIQWAMKFNYDLGNFFDAKQMLPVDSAHFVQGALFAGLPILHRLSRAPCTTLKTGDDIALDPANGKVEIYY